MIPYRNLSQGMPELMAREYTDYGETLIHLEVSFRHEF
jgi:hypothetical protein